MIAPCANLQNPSGSCSAAELFIRRHVAKHPLRFDPQSTVGPAAKIGGSIRTQVLLDIFFGTSYRWQNGVLIEVSDQRQLPQWVKPELLDGYYRQFFSPAHWPSPEHAQGEADIDSFIAHNPAAQAFQISLTRQLTRLGTPDELIRKVIHQSITKTYPNYIEQLHQKTSQWIGRLALPTTAPKHFPLFNEMGIIFSPPSNLRPDFLCIILEVCDLVKAHHPSSSHRENEDLIKKHVEKIYKSLKKNYANVYAGVFSTSAEDAKIVRANYLVVSEQKSILDDKLLFAADPQHQHKTVHLASLKEEPYPTAELQSSEKSKINKKEVRSVKKGSIQQPSKKGADSKEEPVKSSPNKNQSGVRIKKSITATASATTAPTKKGAANIAKSLDSSNTRSVSAKRPIKPSNITVPSTKAIKKGNV